MDLIMGMGSSYSYGCGWVTLSAVLLIFVVHAVRKFFFALSSSSSSPKSPVVSSVPRSPLSSPSSVRSGSGNGSPLSRISETDLQFLIEKLDEKRLQNEKWENVIHKTNNRLSYTAKCCRPKDAPLKYLSVTVFENCTPEVLRDFYMDNDYRVQWDKTLVQHDQLHVDSSDGTEVGRTIKKFPLLTPREYVLAWRLWEGNDNTFYCFIKECDHPLAPRQRKYVRVCCFRSGWRISKVPGRNACEIKMFHQEDAGLNVEMAKLAFARGIWSYVCKMDDALRKYSVMSRPPIGPAVTAVSLIQKVPPGLEKTNIVADTPRNPATIPVDGVVARDSREKKFARKPSGKVLANGLLLLGGFICLSRGHSSLGAKVAMAYVLTKLRKRDASSASSNNQSGAR